MVAGDDDELWLTVGFLEQWASTAACYAGWSQALNDLDV